MVHCYSTGDGNVSFRKVTLAPPADLANTIELVHPLANLNPQPIRRMDRFSRFCTAYMAVATFEATEVAASGVFTTLASVKNNYFDQLNFKYESYES